MRRLHFLLVLCCLSVSAFAANNIIPFRMVNGLIIIEAGYNNSEGQFILDTGSDGLFIDKQNSGKAASSQTYQTLSGDMEVESITIKHFSFGNIKKRNVTAYTTNLTHLENVLQMDLAGIMGTTIFTPHSVYINFTDYTIHFFDSYVDHHKNTLLNSSSFDWENGVPVVKVSIDNAEYSFILDSGASIHLVDFSIMENHKNLITDKNADINLQTLSTNPTENSSKKSCLSELKFENHVYQNINILSIDLSKIQDGFSKKISGILSLSEMANKGVLIDFKNKKIHF
ncbi:MAG: retropepsin-like domain-containing protein [Saprospiraceae bacterium]|nr:retropepsin-like domain-containing protein [Saprospiraceae bacterium]